MMIHMRKSEAYYSVINYLKKLRQTEVCQSKCILKAIFVKVNLGVIRALKNLENIFIGQQ